MVLDGGGRINGINEKEETSTIKYELQIPNWYFNTTYASIGGGGLDGQ